MKSLSFLTFVLMAALAVSAPAQQLFLNEIYASHSGTDNVEFVELFEPGMTGMSLSNIMVLIVEGDSSSSGFGNLDQAWDLSAGSVPLDGYYVLGDMAVANVDFVTGVSNTIENGTETFYLLQAANPAAVLALIGTNVDLGGGVTSVPSLGTILDIIGMTDGDAGDQIFDGAQTLGPDGVNFPAGVYRGGNAPNAFCSAFLDFAPGGSNEPQTPGTSNPACPGGPLYPGNGTDAEMTIRINGGISSPANDQHPAAGGDLVSVQYLSPGGTLALAPFIGYLQLQTTGAISAPIQLPGDAFPTVIFAAAAPTVVLFDGLTNPGALGAPVVDFSQINFGIPGFLSGTSTSIILGALVRDVGINAVNLGVMDTQELIVQ